MRSRTSNNRLLKENTRAHLYNTDFERRLTSLLRKSQFDNNYIGCEREAKGQYNSCGRRKNGLIQDLSVIIALSQPSYLVPIVYR